MPSQANLTADCEVDSQQGQRCGGAPRLRSPTSEAKRSQARRWLRFDVDPPIFVKVWPESVEGFRFGPTGDKVTHGTATSDKFTP